MVAIRDGNPASYSEGHTKAFGQSKTKSNKGIARGEPKTAVLEALGRSGPHFFFCPRFSHGQSDQGHAAAMVRLVHKG
jgi:hypothetical protein